MSDMTGTEGGGHRGRLVLLVAGVAACIAVVIGTGLEWGRLLVNGRLVVAEGGLSLWQGVVALVAAAIAAAQYLKTVGDKVFAWGFGDSLQCDTLVAIAG
ncbi:MAG: hypothetical protein ACPGRF_00720, partial [Miltoncostaeaceae bacterium]